MAEGHDDRPVKPANQRGAARLAAVQALYQMEIVWHRRSGDRQRI